MIFFRNVLLGWFVLWSSVCNADLVWDWQFEQANLGVVDAQAVIQSRVVLKNDSSSTVNIDAIGSAYINGSPSISGYGGGPIMQDGEYNYANEIGFGSQEPFPWTSFSSFLLYSHLNPGESIVFDFIWAKSLLVDGFLPGNYSIDASIMVCGIDCSDWEAKTLKRTLSWTVEDTVAVPESNSVALFILGLCLMICRRKLFSARR